MRAKAYEETKEERGGGRSEGVRAMRRTPGRGHSEPDLARAHPRSSLAVGLSAPPRRDCPAIPRSYPQR
eukprot:249000-Pyramimonas_sp.AAC.1